MKTNFFEAWRRRLNWWLIPLIICLVNALGVLFYQVKLAGNVEILQDIFDTTSKTQSDLEARKEKSRAFLESVQDGQGSHHELYEQHFSTPEIRFTGMIREVKRLAAQAGLEPNRWSYPEALLIGELKRRQVVFSVQGTYNQLRTFINSLEVSDQFLTLERVSLSGASSDKTGQSLSIQIRLSTIFARELPSSES